jgi:lysophospholipase L1-like esterase
LGYSDRDGNKFRKIKRTADQADVTGKRIYYGNYSKYYPGETRIDFDENGNKFAIKMNNKGLRGPDIVGKKDDGTIRIITLGASSTFGYHDRDNETYPYYLQEILNDNLKKYPLHNIKRFEVINFGVPTLKIENIYSLFVNEALPLTPDLVTFYEGHNNVGSEQDILDLNKKYQHNKFFKFVSSTYQEVSHRSLLWVFSSNLVNNVFTKYNVSYLSDDKQIFNDSKTYSSMEFPVFFEAISQNMAKRQEAMTSSFMRHLDLVNRECLKHHIVLLVANQQVSSRTFAHEKLKGKTYQEEVFFVVNKLKNNEDLTSHQLFLLKHALLMKELKSWALKENVPFVDIIKSLDQDRDTLLTSVHLNPRGNKIIAREFADKIFDYFSHKLN